MQAEAAAVVFKNGADPANAARALELLRGQGVNIAGEAPADQAYSTTTVIDHTGNPYTINFIQKALGLSDIRVVNQFDPTAGVDLEIMLGADYVPQ
jgi:ABC-type metal ion transport system substrate-binding protein